jgi:alpha-glucoside transport system ATP-binding protein
VTLLYVETNHVEPIVVKVDGDADYVRGQTVNVTAPLDRLHVFNAEGKAFRHTNAAVAA